MSENDNLFKINVFTLGDSSVGKTSFIIRYANNTFHESYLTTTGIDILTRIITLPNNDKLKIGFYDTAGEERFRSMSLNLMRTADGIFLMYDISSRKSFECISNWIRSIIEAKGNNFPIILLGNKCDLTDKREVQKEEGENLAKLYGFNFFETSNKIGININEAVMDLVLKIYEKNKNRIIKDKLSLNAKRKQKKERCC